MNTDDMNMRQDEVMQGPPTVVIEDAPQVIRVEAFAGVPILERIEAKLDRLAAHLGAG